MIENSDFKNNKNKPHQTDSETIFQFRYIYECLLDIFYYSMTQLLVEQGIF